MKKWTAVLLLAAMAALIFGGCSLRWSSSFGTMVLEVCTPKRWDIQWDTMEGTRSQKLSRKGEEKLVYSVEAEAEALKITLKQGNLEKELPLDGTEISLNDFRNGKIQIIIAVSNGGESKLHFELK